MITNVPKFKLMTILLMLISLLVISLTPVMASSDDALADSQYPKDMNDNQNTGQSQYVGPQNNSTKWNYTTGDPDSEIRYAPSVGPDGTIYLPTAFNNGTNYLANLYALNPDGTKKWNYTIFDGILNENCYNYFVGSPAITQDGTIYITGEFHDNTRTYGMFYAFNPDGTVKWKYILNEGAAVYMSGSPAVGTDGTIYFLSQFLSSDYSRWNGKLNALNPDGSEKWNYIVSDGTSGGTTGSPAIAPDGTIYFVYLFFSDTASNLYALNPDGTKKWNYLLENEYISDHPVVASDGTIYVASSNHLYAINPEGTIKWNYSPSNGFLESAPSVAKDGTIYVGGSITDSNGYQGILYAIDPLGNLKWSFNTVYDVNTAAVIGADGTIYFGDGGGLKTFYALNPDGTIKWSLAVQPMTSAAIARDGTLYFALNLDGTYYLYAIQGPGSNPTNNTNNPVNAATTTSYGNTVGMQSTGIPLAGIILAILMVAGGLVGTHKKL